MRKPGVWLALTLACVSAAQGQVTVEVLQDQEQFLRGESVGAKVRITNRSGRTLRLGAAPEWLSFSVENHDGVVVPKSSEVPVVGEFTIESSERATKQVDLAPYFSLNQPGRYAIIATLRIPGWDHDINSRPKHFDVIEGPVLFEQEIGLPTPGGETGAAPEVRKYIIQQVNHMKQRELRLYLRVTDLSGAKVFKVLPIGSMVSFGRPEFQVDKSSSLHLLYQNGPRSFSYQYVDPDGDLLGRQTYDYGDSRPRLKLDSSTGRIGVAGGTRRLTANDIPKPAPSTNDVSVPKL